MVTTYISNDLVPYQVILGMSAATTVHVHMCGKTALSDEYLCQLLRHGAKDVEIPCTVNRYWRGTGGFVDSWGLGTGNWGF